MPQHTGLAFTAEDVRCLQEADSCQSVVPLDVPAAMALDPSGNSMPQVARLLQWQAYASIDQRSMAEASRLIDHSAFQFLSLGRIPILFALGDWIARYVGRTLFLSTLFEQLAAEGFAADEWVLPPRSPGAAGWEGLDEQLVLLMATEVASRHNARVARCEARSVSGSGNHGPVWRKRFDRRRARLARQVTNVLLGRRGRRRSHILVAEASSWSYVKDAVNRLDARVTVFGDEVRDSSVRLAGYESARRHAMSCIRPDDCLDEGARARVRCAMDQMQAEWKLRQDDIVAAVSEGCILPPSAVRLLIRFLLQHHVPQTLSRIEATNQLFQDHTFDVVLTRIDARDTYRIVPLVARQCGVPSITVQHGIIGTQDTAYGFIPIVSDKLAVYGPGTRQVLEDVGESPDRIAEVGSARFDRYQNDASSDPLEDNSPNPMTVLVVVPSVIVGMTRSFINRLWTSCDVQDCAAAVGALLREEDDVHVIVKFHPSDSQADCHRGMFQLEAGDHTGRLQICFKEPIEPLVQRAGIVVSARSTVGLEAMLNGIPLVEMDFKESTRNARDMKNARAARVARDARELVQQLRELMNDPECRADQISKAGQFVRDKYLFDGQASARTAALIEDMIATARDRSPTVVGVQ